MRDSYTIVILGKERLHSFIAIGITLAIDMIKHPGK